MNKWMLAGLLLAWSAAATAQDVADDRGAYLSLAFGNGRIEGGNASGNTWMRGRTFEVRAGREQDSVEDQPLPDGTAARTDFVHYNEGHPDNNHRDGFALQWVAVRRLGGPFTGELAAGPYLSMNTTVIARMSRRTGATRTARPRTP